MFGWSSLRRIMISRAMNLTLSGWKLSNRTFFRATIFPLSLFRARYTVLYVPCPICKISSTYKWSHLKAIKMHLMIKITLSNLWNMSALRGSQPSMASPATEVSQEGQPAATYSPSVNLPTTLNPKAGPLLFLEFSFFNTVKFPEFRRPEEEENLGSTCLSFSSSSLTSLETKSPDLTLSKPDNDDNVDDCDLFPAAAAFRRAWRLEKELQRGEMSERAFLELTQPMTTPQNPYINCKKIIGFWEIDDDHPEWEIRVKGAFPQPTLPSHRVCVKVSHWRRNERTKTQNT